MARIVLCSIISFFLALPSMAALKEGDTAPDFKADASLAGKVFTFSLQEALKKGPVVVYFYPAAFTSGCNVQAHEFAINYDKFVAAGASVIGVSLDSIDRLKVFSADPNYCGGKVAVASDKGGKIAKAYDLRVSGTPVGATDTQGASINHGLVERTTFIVTPDGKIAATVGGVSPSDNVARALETVKRLGPRPSP